MLLKDKVIPRGKTEERNERNERKIIMSKLARKTKVSVSNPGMHMLLKHSYNIPPMFFL